MNPLPPICSISIHQNTEDGVTIEAKPVDFTIATYVTPWAMSDEKNKSQYSELIIPYSTKKKQNSSHSDPEVPAKSSAPTTKEITILTECTETS